MSDAIGEVLTLLRGSFRDVSPDLLFLFASSHHSARYQHAVEQLGRACPKATLVGCGAQSVIGDGIEVEGRAGVAVLAASLPGVDIRTCHLEADDLAMLGDDPQRWSEVIGLGPSQDPNIILLADPFTFDPEPMAKALDRAMPTSTIVGGLVSGGRQSGDHVLFRGNEMLFSGAVAVALAGDLAMDAVVAQGCRPIGAPLFVTRSHRNLIYELDGRPAAQMLQTLHDELSTPERELMKTSLLLGIEMKQAQLEYRQGDFLIRNLVGVDPESGAIAIGALLRDNQVVQFHLRDAQTSAEDLERRIDRYREQARGEPAGALLFSCLGRGIGLYDKPNHDSLVFRRLLGRVPLGGFFCNGEIGPVEGQTFLHGYTSSFAIFRAR